MCCERVTMHVVGQLLGGDPATVVADQGDRHQARAAAPRASASITLPELPLVESASSASPRAAVGDHLAREDRLGADVVGDRGDDGGVVGEVDRAARAASRTVPAGARSPPRRPWRRSPSRRCPAPAACRRARSALAARRRGPTTPVFARRASERAAPRTSSAFISTEARTSSRTASRSCSLSARNGYRKLDAPASCARRSSGPPAVRGARRTRGRAPTARGRASRPAPGA